MSSSVHCKLMCSVIDVCVCDQCRKDTIVSLETINFRQFVRTLARFKAASKGHEHEMNTRDKKIDCRLCVCVCVVIVMWSSCDLVISFCAVVVFKVYDTDRDGLISKDDLKHVSCV